MPATKAHKGIWLDLVSLGGAAHFAGPPALLETEEEALLVEIVTHSYKL